MVAEDLDGYVYYLENHAHTPDEIETKIAELISSSNYDLVYELELMSRDGNVHIETRRI
jgi:hypothetical protein